MQVLCHSCAFFFYNGNKQSFEGSDVFLWSTQAMLYTVHVVITIYVNEMVTY